MAPDILLAFEVRLETVVAALSAIASESMSCVARSMRRAPLLLSGPLSMPVSTDVDQEDDGKWFGGWQVTRKGLRACSLVHSEHGAHCP